MKLLASLFLAIFMVSSLSAQTMDWASNFNPHGCDGTIMAIAHDADYVYYGGGFTRFGPVAANCIARVSKVNGTISPLGSGIPYSVLGFVKSILVVGNDVYVGGSFSTAGGVAATNIAKWNGAFWSPVGGGITGSNSYVNEIKMIGPDLYVGGSFSSAGGTSANNIAKWNGSVWSSLGSGVTDGELIGSTGVYCLEVSGTDVYVGGNFTVAGGLPIKNIAKWNGTSWSALGGVINSFVNSLHASGSDLYVGGSFSSVGVANTSAIARWNGTNWFAVGTGFLYGNVKAITKIGGDLYVGGETSVGNIAKWNGSNWSLLGNGLLSGDNSNSAGTRVLEVIDNELHCGGLFEVAGGIAARSVAKWTGSSWTSAVPSFKGDGVSYVVQSVLDAGSVVYVGGSFVSAGGTPANRIACWNKSTRTWSALGSGLNGEVYALATSGTDLYAGGNFTSAGGGSANSIAKWNGTSWSALGSGLNGAVRSIAVMGGNLYVGGSFTAAGSMTGTPGIAKWDGSAWSSVGNGITGGVVTALTTDGTTIYAGGDFTAAGGVAAARLARWNGSAWSAMNSGISNGLVNELSVGGGSVYAGGSFSTSGGSSSNGVARWDGLSWQPLGAGVNSTVTGLTFSGTQLYACGWFSTAGGVAATGVAAWNGSSWTPLGSGVQGYPYSITANGAEVYVGGGLSTAGGKSSQNFAIYGPQPEIAVEQPVGTNLNDGLSTVVLSPVAPGSNSTTAFTIRNTGSADLVITDISFGGANAAEFSILTAPSSPVSAGGTATFTVQYTPANADSKTARLQIVSNDQNENPFDILLSVTGTNTVPTIASLTHQTVNEDVGTSTLPLSVSDAETPAVFLSLIGTSTNSSLVPASNIIFGGSGSSRTVRVVPSANATGSATITLTVSDGTLQASSSFLLTVNAINDSPTITRVTDITINEDAVTSARAFTIGDVETAAPLLTVTGTSSDTTLVPNQNIVFGGSGANRNVTVTPAPNQSGTATITLTVSDGMASSSASFVLTVNSVNDLPTISDTPDQIINEDSNTGGLPVSIEDAETAAGSLVVSGTSSNLTLVPISNLVFGGSGASRTLTVTPVANLSGTTIITVTVSDGTTTSNDTFTLTVNAVNDAPTLNSITNPVAILEDSGQQTISLSGISGGGGEFDTLTITARSDNNSLIANPSVTYTNPNSNGSVLYTPTANLSGTATITITVNDGQAVNNTISRTFVVTVTSVNDAPTLDTIPSPAAILEDASLQTVSLSGITAGPLETQLLLVTATSSNTSLIPHPTINYSSPSNVGSLSYTPVSNASGSATITVVVNDQQASNNTVSRAFIVTVNAVNDTPTISSITDRNVNEDTSTGTIAFTIGDVETAASSLTVTRSSNNTGLVPTANIVFGGTGTNRTVSISPAANQSGTATITITVSDGSLTASTSLAITVNSINDPPTISGIANQVITYNTLSNTLDFTLDDIETPAALLTLTASSSSQSLLPDASIFLNGSGASRGVTLVPSFDQTGVSIVTLMVNDGETSTTTSFMLTVNAPEIVLEQPFASGLADGGTRDFGNSSVGSTTSRVFYIRNTNTAALTGLTITVDGTDSSQFSITASPIAPVHGPGGNTAFTVQFAPTSAGAKTCALHIASNDPDESPFDIVLTGNGTIPQSSWRQTHFGSTSNSGNAADLADPDGDGICNLLEYALGLHPGQNSSGQMPQATRIAGDIVYTFTEPVGVTGVTYSAEWSSTLSSASWTSVGITHSVSNGQHTFSMPVGATQGAFLRLKILVP